MGSDGNGTDHDDTYTHGHHASVLRSHEWRTAENSAGYLLPRLRAGQRLLDVGCGPGTITVDLARRVAPGEVVGIDRAPEVIERARANAAAAPDTPPGVRFEVDDVYALAQPDAAFDVVHAHQVLQHLTDPVAALRELRRVLAPGGTLAVRDSDYGGFVWSPADPRLTRWLELYHRITAANGAEADAGRHLGAWVRAAGFDHVVVSTSTWTFAEPETRAWWGDLWAERVTSSAFADQAVAYGLSDRGELEDLAAAWRGWAADPDAFFAVLHAEVLATR
jgi:SAM-dependent methyltransferase